MYYFQKFLQMHFFIIPCFIFQYGIMYALSSSKNACIARCTTFMFMAYKQFRDKFCIDIAEASEILFLIIWHLNRLSRILCWIIQYLFHGILLNNIKFKQSAALIFRLVFILILTYETFLVFQWLCGSCQSVTLCKSFNALLIQQRLVQHNCIKNLHVRPIPFTGRRSVHSKLSNKTTSDGNFPFYGHCTNWTTVLCRNWTVCSCTCLSISLSPLIALTLVSSFWFSLLYDVKYRSVIIQIVKSWNILRCNGKGKASL